jgi:hypothetical protein
MPPYLDALVHSRKVTSRAVVYLVHDGKEELMSNVVAVHTMEGWCDVRKGIGDSEIVRVHGEFIVRDAMTNQIWPD